MSFVSHGMKNIRHLEYKNNSLSTNYLPLNTIKFFVLSFYEKYYLFKLCVDGFWYSIAGRYFVFKDLRHHVTDCCHTLYITGKISEPISITLIYDKNTSRVILI